jgi:hypothetical protein
MTKHYVEFTYAGSFFSEMSSRSVESRDPSKVVMPSGAYAFRFYDQEEVELNGDTLVGTPKNLSPRYIRGEKVTLEQAERLPNSDTLVSNMNGNGWGYVVKCPQGHIAPEEGEIFI